MVLLIKMMQLIFEKSKPGRKAYSLPACDVPVCQPENWLPDKIIRKQAVRLPSVSEPVLIRHFTALADRNHGVDSGFYPLGSCTMKYNPKINEKIARMEGFSQVHPLQDEQDTQGCLAVLYELDRALCAITGMARFTLQPAAGAHGELTGLLMIKAWQTERGQPQRDEILIPDSAHGTNPASAALAGFKVVEIASDQTGSVSISALRQALGPKTAGMMLTNPNTLGLFEKEIESIAQLVHEAGGLLYYDGANANAILGKVRPGDMGFDIVHLNLHKTFSTPHGGGGPGAGPVGVSARLVDYLPAPVVARKKDQYYLDDQRPLSIGRVKAFNGHFAVALRALVYIRTLGAEGLTEVSETAVLNANYLQNQLSRAYDLPYKRTCMHECVLSAQTIKEETGVSTLDIAKRLLDDGFHPPTIYFPLIVKEALMIEPTETESKETLDLFVSSLLAIKEEAYQQPDKLKQAPALMPVGRLNETLAARKPILRYDFSEDQA